MPFSISELSQYDPACRACVKRYIKKHDLKRGDTFKLPCHGIKRQALDDYILSGLADPETALSMYDPVLWAKKNLDWICLDPEGDEWKRKSESGALPSGFAYWTPREARRGKSPFHRPYQAELLRCSSKRKVSRIGRQAGKSEALCVFILFKMFTERGYSVVVITPYQSQVELIYKRLFELLETNPELINSVKNRRKSPNHYIELHNGSSIKMFTAGTKSNAEAGVVRGTHANLLIFDEADMLSRGDLDSSLALIMNFPEAIVWMSSTPTGKRETFYKKCNDDEFKEFHFPSSVNPTWNDEKERFFRKGLTELGYVHEILADFGEDVQGVYQKKYIAAAQADYEYDSMEPQRTWIYSMGVDWNDNFGTVIRIVGMNPGDNCIYAVARHLVKRDGWTQTDAVAQIVNLNRKWQPQFIYVDKGHGHAQVELLHGVGAKAMRKGGNSVDVRLASIVKAYDFGSNVEIKDLFTRQPVKKPAKPFLVESSVRCFEDGRIRYPKSDTKYTAALEGYHIVRRTDAGIPKYGFLDEAVGDHDIDAMNLAIVAFALEVGEFGNPPHVSNVAFSGYFGENKAEQEERKERIKETENRSKELGKRTTDLMKPAIVRSFGMPAANTTYDREESANIRVWSWPGWLRDEPAPKRKNRGRRSRPSRTNI